jgi:hypothetical protein
MVLKIILFIISVFLLWIIYNLISRQLKIFKCKKAITKIFPINKIEKPEFKSGTSYWYPRIELIFTYQEDYDYVKGNNYFSMYVSEIQSIYSGIENFEAKRAVLFKTYGRIKNKR